MNYRQWKKKFKKEHGRNPYITEDKRKRNKAAAAALCNIDWVALHDGMQQAINRLAPALFSAVATFSKALSAAFGNAAEAAENIAERYEALQEHEEYSGTIKAYSVLNNIDASKIVKYQAPESEGKA